MVHPTKRFQDKVVLITGGSSGIGKAAVIAFVEEGAKVMLADVNEEAGNALAKQLGDAGHAVRFQKTDVANPDEVKALVKATLESFGRLDIALNNAGIGGSFAPTHAYTLEEWNRVIAINQTGVFLCLKAEIRAMLKQGGGSIINVSSMGGKKGMPGAIAYSAAKHAVLGLTRSAAAEYGRANIRVNAICPAFTETPLVEGLQAEHPSYIKNFIKIAPKHRLAKPEEVADAILWLADDRSDFVTGIALDFDGGLSA